MRCPYCGSTEDRVLESRQNTTGNVIRRRRECAACGSRFTSYEKTEETPLMIQKKSGELQEFNLEKLKKGILTATRKRRIPQSVIDNMIAETEDAAEYAGRKTRVISSSLLGDLILEKLKAVDAVAYIRYASVYKNFDDLKRLITEIKQMDKK